MTVAVDLSRLEAEIGPGVDLLSGEWVRPHSRRASDAFQGFADAARLDLTVRLAAIRGDRSPALSLIVQHSDDGLAWSTAAGPFAFTSDGLMSASVDSPKDYLRVVWETSGGLREAVIGSVRAVAGILDAAGGGNGGSQPEVTDGVTTIASASSLVFPAGTVADLGAGRAGITVQTLLLGPEVVTFETPDIRDGALVFALASGVTVVRAWAIIDDSFGGGLNLILGLGGPDFGPPDDDWGTLISYSTGGGAEGGSGYELENSAEVWSTRVGTLTADGGGLVAYISGGDPVAGSARIYALIAVPA